MLCVVMVVIALRMPIAQAADESDQARIAFLHSLGMYISGQTCGRTIEINSSDGEIIGRIEYEMYGNIAVCEPIGSIECLEVDARFRRRGIGTHLFKTALDDMRSQGCRHVSWQATKESLPFYEHQGAQCLYAESSHYGMHIQITEELALPLSRLHSIINKDASKH